MTELTYYKNAYETSFKAIVKKSEGNEVTLDKTTFFPGGGGQDCDDGMLEFGSKKAKVLRTFEREGEIVHVLENNILKPGFRVQGSINWEKRYKLMKSHTAEHLLFGRMLKLKPDLEIVKISIKEDGASFFVNGEVDWELMLKAQTLANEKVQADDEVEARVATRDQAKNIKGLRIKWDAVPETRIRIVKIGNYDFSSCTGLHVKKTGEIGFILVTGISSGRDADTEIGFLTSWDAKAKALKLATLGLECAKELGTTPENAAQTIRNMQKELGETRQGVRELSKAQIQEIKPENIGPYKVYTKVLDGASEKELAEQAGLLIRKEDCIVILCNRADKAFVLIAASDRINIDCLGLLKKALDIIGGEGGGRRNFAMGGGPLIEKLEEAITSIKKDLRF